MDHPSSGHTAETIISRVPLGMEKTVEQVIYL